MTTSRTIKHARSVVVDLTNRRHSGCFNSLFLLLFGLVSDQVTMLQKTTNSSQQGAAAQRSPRVALYSPLQDSWASELPKLDA